MIREAARSPKHRPGRGKEFQMASSTPAWVWTLVTAGILIAAVGLVLLIIQALFVLAPVLLVVGVIAAVVGLVAAKLGGRQP